MTQGATGGRDDLPLVERSPFFIKRREKGEKLEKRGKRKKRKKARDLRKTLTRNKVPSCCSSAKD